MSVSWGLCCNKKNNQEHEKKTDFLFAWYLRDLSRVRVRRSPGVSTVNSLRDTEYMKSLPCNSASWPQTTLTGRTDHTVSRTSMRFILPRVAELVRMRISLCNFWAGAVTSAI